MSIINQKQYEITKEHLHQFQLSLSELSIVDTTEFSANDIIRHQFYIDTVQSQLIALQEKLFEYENTKSRTTRSLSITQRFLAWVRSHFV